MLNEVRASLYAGHYNLLLGSGASYGSTNSGGKPLPSAAELTENLCRHTGAPITSTLAQVSRLLKPQEVEKFISKPFSGCRPGDGLKRLTQFVWKTIYTFNVDDALEAAYERTTGVKQHAAPVNFTQLYSVPTDKSRVQIVHLHGFTREAEIGYVFSVSDYGRAIREGNAWMHVLSQVIATEPFILAGTTLNEPDLEYYLANRTEASSRSGRGPSLLIEPYPNRLTEDLCERHNLLLVKSTLADFLEWLIKQVGDPPSVSQIVVPSLHGVFHKPLPIEDNIAFFTDFDLITQVAPNPEGMVSQFYFGKRVKWSDLESEIDVSLDDNLIDKVRGILEGATPVVKTVCIVDEAGSGKSTQIRRAAYDLAKQGQVVFSLRPNSTVRPHLLAKVAQHIDRPCVLLIDGAADQVSSLRDAISLLKVTRPFVILTADRDYRKEHIQRLIGDFDVQYESAVRWELPQFESLIDNLRRVGLLALPGAVTSPRQYASKLLNDTVTIATCRALNNFKPLETIIKTVWKDATEAQRRSYSVAALAEHCHSGGVHYSILEACYSNPHLDKQLTEGAALQLAYSEDDDYVLPLHPVTADRLLRLLSVEKPELLLDIFCSLAEAIAPFVNRRTVIDRTPEALLAARLFHAESVVKPLLRTGAKEFYTNTHDAWQWNSRYWEQRALFMQHEDINLGIQYARHAVAIEQHPFPWTTLATLLTKKLETTSVGFEAIYDEIIDHLNSVRDFEIAKNWRATPHPYWVLINSTQLFLAMGGVLGRTRKEWVKSQLEVCSRNFGKRMNEVVAPLMQRLDDGTG